MKRYLLNILLVGTFCSSCSDFLTENPEHALTDINSVTDYSSAKNAVNGIYYNYESCEHLGGSLCATAYCMAGLWNYRSDLYNMRQSQKSSTGAPIWNSLYKVINSANSAIQGIEKLDDSKFPSKENKNELIAQAKCMRGFSNLQLLWYFGHWFANSDSPYGIIYRDQVSDLSNIMLNRSSVGESYEKIISDLEYAEEWCSDYKSARYTSKQFAQALHAKLLLIRNWEGDYQKSLEIVNHILNNAPSTFKMETDLAKLYKNGWNSSEVLFSRYLGDNPIITDVEFEYSYNLYYFNEFTDIPQKWLEDDERSTYFFGEARAPETWDTSRKKNILTKLYHRGRFEGKNDMYSTMVIRYAELYLMKAELLARLNPSDKESDINMALQPINEMRASYTSPVLKPITGILTHNDLMDAIYKEYVVTLFLENDSPWFASLRFNKDGGDIWAKALKPEVSFSENQYCLPIPDNEIIAHTNPIPQNPGLE